MSTRIPVIIALFTGSILLAGVSFATPPNYHRFARPSRLLSNVGKSQLQSVIKRVHIPKTARFSFKRVSYTDIGQVPGAWRSSSIATQASNAIATQGSYTPGSSSPSPSYVPSNSSSAVNVNVTSGNRSQYESLRSESQRISGRVVNGTATRSEVESYNSRARDLGSR